MDLPPSDEGALAQPTRARIFAYLVDQRAPMGTDDLAGHFDLHANGVRRHLELLLAEGLIKREKVRAGQGRPRDIWTVASGARPGGERPHAYADLARWLARALPAGKAGQREIERIGNEIGRELAPTDAEDTAVAFRDAAAALGFEPTLDPTSEGFACTLGNCPYRDSVRESPSVVCGLHRGITAGILAQLEPDAELTTFEPHDPDRAGCVVKVRVPAQV